MDDDLRELERRASLDPAPALRVALVRARARAGLDVASHVRAVAEAHARLVAARGRWAEAMVHAARSFLGGAFDEHPGLRGVHVDWSLVEGGVDPWRVDLALRPVPGERANVFTDGDADGLHAALLRFAAVLPSQHEFDADRRIVRDGAHVRIVDPGLDWRARRERRAPPLATRPLLLRHVEDVTDALQARRTTDERETTLGPGPIVIGQGDTTAAQLLADGADEDLADATAAFLAEGEPAWAGVVPALFVEHEALEGAALQGYTPGYNDNWYDEHRLEVSVEAEELRWALDPADRAGLEVDVLADLEGARGLPAGPEARAIHDALRAFEPWLRLRRGHRYAGALRRGGLVSGAARFGPGGNRLA